MQTTHKIFYVVFAAFVLFALYCFNPLNFYFLNDDFIHISLAKEHVLFQRNSLRPIGDLSLMLDYYLGKLNATQYHTTNLILHILNSILIIFCTKKLLNKYLNVPNIQAISFLTAIIFFIYPFHSESIFWILGRSASLGMFFFLLSLNFFFEFEKSLLYKFLFYIFYVIGLFSYESVWVLPIFIFIFFLIENKHLSFQRKQKSIQFNIVFLFIAYLIFRKVITNEFLGTYETNHFQNFDIYELCKNFLGLVYRSMIPPFVYANNFIIIAVILCIFIYVVYLLKNKKFNIFFLGIVFLLSLFPYLSLGVDTHSSEGERFLYMPSYFIILFLVISIFQFIKNFTARYFIVSIIMAYCCYFLYTSQKNYSHASTIVKTTMSIFKNIETNKTIYIDSLPVRVGGAAIFRTGFEESLNLMQEKKVKIIVCTTKKNENKQAKEFSIIAKEFMGKKDIQEILIPDTTFKNPYISKKINLLEISKANSIYIKFLDEGVEVYQ
jgi:hypothetical protein